MVKVFPVNAWGPLVTHLHQLIPNKWPSVLHTKHICVCMCPVGFQVPPESLPFSLSYPGKPLEITIFSTKALDYFFQSQCPRKKSLVSISHNILYINLLEIRDLRSLVKNSFKHRKGLIFESTDAHQYE